MQHPDNGAGTPPTSPQPPPGAAAHLRSESSYSEHVTAKILKVSKNIKLPSTHIYSKQKHSWSNRYLKMFSREEKTILITIFLYESSVRWM